MSSLLDTAPRAEPAPAAPAARAAGPPRSLLLLLAAVAVVTACWALYTPAWQAPDETQHFGYAQSVADRFALPGKRGRQKYSSEHELSDRASRTGQTARIAGAEWRPEEFARWRRENQALPPGSREDGGGPNSASPNPPLYYAFTAPAYWAASGGDVHDRLFLMRLWSGLLLLVTVAATWLLAGELFGRRRVLQLLAGAVVGLQPMMTFLSASVTPDALLFALWALAFWLGARILRRGLTLLDAMALMGVVGLNVVTKATGYTLLPAALFVVGLGAWRLGRQRGVPMRRAATVAAIGLLAFAVPAGGWVAATRALDRPVVNKISSRAESVVPERESIKPKAFAGYLADFYLPVKIGRSDVFPKTVPLYSVWFQGSWGRFAWRQFQLPNPVFMLLFWAAVALGAAAAVAAWRRRREIDWAVLGFFGLAAGALLAGLHVAEYRVVFVVHERGDFNQGRYILPLIPLAGITAAAGVTLLRRRLRPYAAAGILAALAVLQVFSLGVVTEWFYA